MTKGSEPKAIQGKHIRIVRQRIGMTLDELAEKTGLSKALLARIETGERTLSEANKTLIARAIVAGIDEFLSLAGNKAFRQQFADFGMPGISAALELITVGKRSNKSTSAHGAS